MTESLLRDVRYVLRMMRGHPFFTAVVALSLAIGGVLGIAFAAWGIRALTLVSALNQTRAGEIRLQLSLSQALVVPQIAISLLLVVGAGLFVRTLANLNSVQFGFNSDKLLLVSMDASQAGHKDDALMRFYQDLRTRMAAIPGVRAVTLSNYALVAGSTTSTGVVMPGVPEKNRGTAVLEVGPGFFNIMQIPILLGREIDERDGNGAARVAVVDEVFVKTYFGGRNPIGRHFGLHTKDSKEFEIIGVAKTARLNTLKKDAPEIVYVPYQQDPWHTAGRMVYEVKAAGDPLGVAAAVRQAVREGDERIPISNIVTQEKQIDQTIGQERTFAMLCTCFALLAVVIACVGVYGTMAYSVARRTNEIGIRMALGAGCVSRVWAGVAGVTDRPPGRPSGTSSRGGVQADVCSYNR